MPVNAVTHVEPKNPTSELTQQKPASAQQSNLFSSQLETNKSNNKLQNASDHSGLSRLANDDNIDNWHSLMGQTYGYDQGDSDSEAYQESEAIREMVRTNDWSGLGVDLQQVSKGDLGSEAAFVGGDTASTSDDQILLNGKPGEATNEAITEELFHAFERKIHPEQEGDTRLVNGQASFTNNKSAATLDEGELGRTLLAQFKESGTVPSLSEGLLETGGITASDTSSVVLNGNTASLENMVLETIAPGDETDSISDELIEAIEESQEEAYNVDQGSEYEVAEEVVANVTVDDLSLVAEGLGLSLTDAELTSLRDSINQLTDNDFADNNYEEHRHLSATGATVGAAVGAATGFALGLAITANPILAVYIAGAAAAAGANIGEVLTTDVAGEEDYVEPESLTSATGPAKDSLVNVTATGGPYPSNNVWKDLLGKANFPIIGDGLEKAGVMLPPDQDGNIQQYYPDLGATSGAVLDDNYVGTDSPIGNVRMMTVVVVETDDGSLQLRTHPDNVYPDLPGHVNHSQLTQGSRIMGLLGDNGQDVMAAGELYYTDDGNIIGMTTRSGHYYDRGAPAEFSANVEATMKDVLGALGYETSSLLVDDEMTQYFNGVLGATDSIWDETAASTAGASAATAMLNTANTGVTNSKDSSAILSNVSDVLQTNIKNNMLTPEIRTLEAVYQEAGNTLAYGHASLIEDALAADILAGDRDLSETTTLLTLSENGNTGVITDPALPGLKAFAAGILDELSSSSAYTDGAVNDWIKYDLLGEANGANVVEDIADMLDGSL